MLLTFPLGCLYKFLQEYDKWLLGFRSSNLLRLKYHLHIIAEKCQPLSFYRLNMTLTLYLRALKDVRAHCYCASLVRTLFIGHARATSFSSARTDSKTQQNIERMTFALTWCANIFVGCSVTPLFFRQITSFSDSFPHTKKQKKSVCGKF